MSGLMTFEDQRRSTYRAPVNPLDKTTIFSVCPKEIKEVKPTIQPGYFHIPAGSPENPVRLLVTPSSWWKDVDDNQPLLEIPISSIVVGESVVADYCKGLLGCDMSLAMPGLFFIPGDISIGEMRSKYSTALKSAIDKQKNWFAALVKMADIGWARSNGNPLCIGDDMRLAAEQLNLKDKDWMSNITALEMIRCTMCGSMRNPLFPMCGNCHTIIDKDRAKELGITIQ